MAGRVPDSEQMQCHYARGLGYAGAGVVPMLLILSLISPELSALAKRLSLIYGAAILAFLGGIQWGIALTWGKPKIALRRMCVSMVPPIWAVVALSMPSAWCANLLITGLITLLVYEWFEQGDATYPAWYLPLRLQLTILLSVGIALTLLI